MEQRTSDNPKGYDKPVNVNQPDQKFEVPEKKVQAVPKRTAKKWDVEPKVIHDISDLLLKDDFVSPYPQAEDLEIGSGLFIITEPNQTIDELMDKVNSEVLRLNEYWSVPAHNDRGEEILDQVTIKEYKRNEDDTIKVTADNRPIEGAMFSHILRRVQIRQYVAKTVTADVDNDQIDDDGALIVRVF